MSSFRPFKLMVGAMLLFIATGSLAQAATVTIKIATLAPEGSTWYKALRQMGDQWAEISNGDVQLKIYAGGVVGNEGAMVRKMRIGQLHAGAVTNLGLMDIDPSAQVTQAPMLIQSYDELDYVMKKMGPEFERRIAEKGFVLLNWGDAGWVHFFSNAPMLEPKDANQFKTYAWSGDPTSVEIFKAAGFTPVVLDSTDVLPSLQSGLVNAFPGTPLSALALQWFALAKHMLDVPWAPLMGGTVITKEAWDSIPAQYHEPFLKAAREVGDSIKDEVRRQDKKAIEVMKKYGLTVHAATPEQKAAWEKIAVALYPIVRTKMVPPEIFDEAKRHVEAYRSGSR